MTINVKGKEYQIEFTVEASLYGECAETVMRFMQAMSEGQSAQDTKTIISGMSNLPQITLTMFYAGLLEHHGIDGDNSVPNKKAAKALLKEYFSEHKADGHDNFYDLMSLLFDQMGEDGFFRQMGLTQIMEDNQAKDQAQRPIVVAKAGKK